MIFDIKSFMDKYDLQKKEVAYLIGCSYSDLFYKIRMKKISIKEYDILDNYKENYKNQK
jgi:hypothetical protein